MRRLTQDEVRLAHEVFGDLIDYGRVRLLGHPFGAAAVTLGSWIAFPRPLPPSFAREPIPMQAWFVHEVTHVWQFQGGWAPTLWSWLKTLLSGGYGRGRSGYRYGLPLGAWGGYNREQQASMVEHAFVLRAEGACAAAPEGMTLADYEACVPLPGAALTGASDW
jgi:hypothetical protein